VVLARKTGPEAPRRPFFWNAEKEFVDFRLAGSAEG
jgi:hypothetical protein